jgi:anti-sigma B factor antagonist
MDKSPLEITVDWTGTGSVIRLTGDLDNSSQPDLDAAYEAASQVDGGIVLDFEHAGFIDSTGIAAILRLLRRARTEGRAVSASGLSAHYREVFEITHVSDFVTFEPGPQQVGDTEITQSPSGRDERHGGS